jgi:hypothetical protein
VTQRPSFAKLQRDRDKQAKAAAKRVRRQERDAGGATPTPALSISDSGEDLTATELLNLVGTVHRQFEEGVIDFDTFEEAKASILSRLPVD